MVQVAMTTTAREAALAHPRFELIPIAGMAEQAALLPRGATATVTCSPARGIEHTLDHAEQLARLGLHAVPHIAARLVRDEAHLRTIVGRLAAGGIREIFVVGGDVAQPVGAFTNALALLHALNGPGHPFEAIGVTAYPDHHPAIDDATLRATLLAKQQLATYMVTQICFDAATILRWLASARAEGVTLPVYIGLPGVIDGARMLRIAMKIGVGPSVRYLTKNTGLVGHLVRPRPYRPTALIEALAPMLADPSLHIAGLHLNTFNQVEGTEAWRREMLG